LNEFTYYNALDNFLSLFDPQTYFGSRWMDIKYKPDFERAKTYWQAYWQHEIIDRPVVCVTTPKDGVTPKPAMPYLSGFEGNYLSAFQICEEWAATHHFGGEAIPYCDIAFGPDQFTAFLGAELQIADDRATSWTKPYVTEWESIHPQLDLSKDGSWNKMLDFLRQGVQYSEGKFLMGMLDLHSNMDCLNSMRGPQNLCMDLIYQEDQVDRVMKEVRALYPPIYEQICEAGDMEKRGTIGWSPFYCEDRSAVIQCDFICMVGPKHARKFILPAIAEEAAYLDHCVYHYDGIGALTHLDDILSIPEIDVIQWVPGEGHPRTVEWMSLLQKIQKAGKGLWLYDWTIDEIKAHYKELKPEGICFHLSAASQQEADDLLDWLVKNT
jgi:hypothetical protein